MLHRQQHFCASQNNYEGCECSCSCILFAKRSWKGDEDNTFSYQNLKHKNINKFSILKLKQSAVLDNLAGGWFNTVGWNKIISWFEHKVI